MKELKKLSYYQICSFAAQNMFHEIPDEYTIKWANGIRPGKVIDERIKGTDVTIMKNSFPIPGDVRLTGSYSVVVPNPDSDDSSLFEEIDFGEVLLQTRFNLDDIVFCYYDDVSSRVIEDVCVRINESFNMRSGFIPKRNLTFDASISLPNGYIQLTNLMMLKVICNNQPITKDNLKTIVYFNYDMSSFNYNK